MSMSHRLDLVDLSCDSVGEELGAVLGEHCRVADPPSVVFAKLDIVKRSVFPVVRYVRLSDCQRTFTIKYKEN